MSVGQRVRRLLVLVAVVMLPGIAMSAPAIAAVTAMSRFHQQMYGHDRSITVNKSNVITEKISSGCCAPVSTFKLKLTHVHYNRLHQPVGHARVIAIHYDRGATHWRGVHVGSTGQAIIKRGVYHDSIIKATFCNMKADIRGACGA